MKRWVCMHVTVIRSFYPAFIVASPWLRKLYGHFSQYKAQVYVLQSLTLLLLNYNYLSEILGEAGVFGESSPDPSR